jgi:hypothetical protein
MNSKVREILEPLMRYEEWLETNHEGFAEARRGYTEAQRNQMNAPTIQEANEWQDLRLTYADQWATIREEMKETYQKANA